MIDDEELKKKFKDMNLTDLGTILGVGLEVLYDKLKEEGFGDTIGIAGFMQCGYNSIVATDVTDMSPGDVNYNYQTFRIL